MQGLKELEAQKLRAWDFWAASSLSAGLSAHRVIIPQQVENKKRLEVFLKTKAGLAELMGKVQTQQGGGRKQQKECGFGT